MPRLQRSRWVVYCTAQLCTNLRRGVLLQVSNALHSTDSSRGQVCQRDTALVSVTGGSPWVMESPGCMMGTSTSLRQDVVFHDLICSSIPLR